MRAKPVIASLGLDGDLGPVPRLPCPAGRLVVELDEDGLAGVRGQVDIDVYPPVRGRGLTDRLS